MSRLDISYLVKHAKNILMALRTDDLVTVHAEWSNMIEDVAGTPDVPDVVAVVYARTLEMVDGITADKAKQKAMTTNAFKAYTKLKVQLAKSPHPIERLITQATAVKDDPTELYLLESQTTRRAKQQRYGANEFWMSDESSGRSSGEDDGRPTTAPVSSWEDNTSMVNVTVDFKAGVIPVDPDRMSLIPMGPHPQAMDGTEPYYTHTYDWQTGERLSSVADIHGKSVSKMITDAVQRSTATTSTQVPTCSLCTDPLFDVHYQCLDCPDRVLLCSACESSGVPIGPNSTHNLDHAVVKLRPGQVWETTKD